MKNLVIIFALMCGAMFTACGNTAKNAEQVDSTKVDSVMVDSVVVDTVALDSVQ